MGDNNTNPCGITIKLEKDILWAPHRGNDYILGYFDRITFQLVKHWLDFSPRASAIRFDGKNPKATKQSLPSYPLSGYPIKLLFPSSKMITRLENFGLDYQSWRGNISALLDRYPCITVALVNLTDEFKGRWPQDVCGKQLERFAKIIRDGKYLPLGTQDETPVPFAQTGTKNVHLCILPSLGYSDYCILLAEEDWSFAPVLIEYLHRATFDDKAILSTDYVMPVYHIFPKSPKRPICSNGHKQGIRLSMRVHMKPGAPMGELQRLVGDSIDIYQLSGSSDCLLNSKEGQNFSELLRMVMADHKKGADKIKNLVISTESTLQRSVSYTAETQNWVKFPAPKPQNQRITNLRNVLIKYWKLLDETNRHMRLFSATWERVTAIENICRQPHNRTLQKIMDQWLIAFTDCLNRGLEATTSIKQNLEQEKDDGRWKELDGQLNEQWARIEEALEIFVIQVGSFLADLSRSDCFSMESERYNHASVSSATALLLAYNQWQNKFVEAVLNEEANKVSRYAFLVCSGGCDHTHTNNIFSDLEPDVRKVLRGKRKAREDLIENMPLITHMSEMALFDCSGAVLRMTHECMHYCGNRLRKARVTYVLDFTARYFGRFLAYSLFSEKDYCESLISCLKSTFQIEDDKLSGEIKSCWASEVQQLSKMLAEALRNILIQRYQEDSTCLCWDERNYMSADLIQWLQDELSRQFLWYFKTDGPLENRYPYSEMVTVLYCKMLNTAVRFYDRCSAIVREREKGLTFCSVERRRLASYLKQFNTTGEYRAQDLKRFIIAILNHLLTDDLCQPPQQDRIGIFGDCNLANILEHLVFNCYSETFADLEACMRLDASLADYILAFVFEEWNVSVSLPRDAPHAFRVSSMLRVCFPDALNDEKTALTEAARKELEVAVENLSKHQLPEKRLKFEDVANQIDLLLRTYHQECEWVAEPLEDYLRLCQNDYNSISHDSMTMYQRAFKRIRLLDGNVDSDGVVQMFSSLISIGEVSGLGEST